MMVFTSIYGVVDGFFVSNFAGKTPFAAVNLVMPFIMILASAGFMLGTGGTALVAMVLGTGDREKANRIFSSITEVSVICGIIATVFGVLLMEPIAKLLGATEEMLPYCVTYGRTVMLFGTAFFLQQMFQTFFSAAEKPKLGLRYTLAAGVTNMALDALLVGVLKWGVSGAALATGISMCVGGILPLIYFIRENDSLLRFRLTRIDVRAVLKACYNGLSEVVSNISISVVSIAYNFQLLKFLGENGVAAYGVLMYVVFIFIAVFLGFTMGSSPVISYHYGAGDREELKGLLKRCIIFMACTGVLMAALSEILAPVVSGLYVGYDEELMKLTVRAFRLYSGAFVFTGFNILVSAFFTALNNGTISAAVSFFRTFIMQLACVLLIPVVMGENGIWLANIFAEVMSVAICVLFLVKQRRKYGY
ncbi:MAG: MATE family efflux transporter [Parasporobacterium sp.]|nr:MATE family efflux transporter [Parasporobacterium sp.]